MEVIRYALEDVHYQIYLQGMHIIRYAFPVNMGNQNNLTKLYIFLKLGFCKGEKIRRHLV